MYRIIVVVALVVTTASCTSTYDPDRLLDKAFEPTYVSLSGVVVDVEIEDVRQDTTSRELRVPTFSFPWNDDEIQPALTPDHRAFIESEIRKYFAEGDELTVRVAIIKAAKRFKANWMSEGEEAECELSVELMRGGSDSRQRGFVGGAVIKMQSLDASASKIDEIYLKVIAASIEKCMAAYAELEEGSTR